MTPQIIHIYIYIHSGANLPLIGSKNTASSFAQLYTVSAVNHFE